MDLYDHIAKGTNSLLNLRSLLDNLIHLRDLERILAEAPTVYEEWGAHGEFWAEKNFKTEDNSRKAKLVLIEEIKD